MNIKALIEREARGLWDEGVNKTCPEIAEALTRVARTAAEQALRVGDADEFTHEVMTAMFGTEEP